MNTSCDICFEECTTIKCDSCTLKCCNNCLNKIKNNKCPQCRRNKSYKFEKINNIESEPAQQIGVNTVFSSLRISSYDTVFSSLRISSYDIRSNIPNPIQIVAPYILTTTQN